jgi:hypothetical protein
VVLFLVMLILRLWWGQLAEARIAAAVAAARADGEPISPDDFNAPDPPPPADRNAVVALKAAAAGVSLNPAQATFVGAFDPKKPLTQFDSNMMANLLSANRRSLALADKAASLPRADWGYRLVGTVYDTPVPRMIGQAQLSRLLCIAAVDSHLGHDDQRAVGYLADLLRQADAANHSPTLIGHLLALVVYRNACSTIDQLAGDLSIDSGPASATRAQIRALITQLLDETNRVRFVTQGWYLERLSILQVISGPTSVFAQIAPWPQLAWILKPMYQFDALHDMNYLSATARALAQPNFAAPSPWVFAPPFSLRGFSQRQSRYVMPNTTGRVSAEFEQLLQRRVTAVELAIRLYEIDHGSAPKNLESLVPTYLPAIPADPFSPPGEPLQYTDTAIGGNGRMIPIHPAAAKPQ